MSDFQPSFLNVRSEGRDFRYNLGNVCRLGRNEDNELVLSDNLVSRYHAILYCAGTGEYHINDLGSSNGTLVNKARVVAPTLLNDGDKILIGNSELIFHQPAAGTATHAHDLASTSIVITQRLITVMVVDIRGFTMLAQRINPETLSQVTSTLFRESGQVLQQRGAWAQKYIGDAVMAVWQHNQNVELQESLIILDALSLIAAIAAGLQTRFGLSEPLRVGAGLNTGLASVGNLGSVAASDYTAVGDTVNKAFRLESATKEVGCDVLLGPSTYATLSGLPGLAAIFRPYSISVKGYDAPIPAFGTSFALLALALEAEVSAKRQSRDQPTLS